jgi:hypothetical protein
MVGEGIAGFIKMMFVLYGILSVVSGVISKSKNMSFIFGFFSALMFTPVITIPILANQSPNEEGVSWWQKL